LKKLGQMFNHHKMRWPLASDDFVGNFLVVSILLFSYEAIGVLRYYHLKRPWRNDGSGGDRAALWMAVCHVGYAWFSIPFVVLFLLTFEELKNRPPESWCEKLHRRPIFLIINIIGCVMVFFVYGFYWFKHRLVRRLEAGWSRKVVYVVLPPAMAIVVFSLIVVSFGTRSHLDKDGMCYFVKHDQFVPKIPNQAFRVSFALAHFTINICLLTLFTSPLWRLSDNMGSIYEPQDAGELRTRGRASCRSGTPSDPENPKKELVKAPCKLKEVCRRCFWITLLILLFNILLLVILGFATMRGPVARNSNTIQFWSVAMVVVDAHALLFCPADWHEIFKWPCAIICPPRRGGVENPELSESLVSKKTTTKSGTSQGTIPFPVCYRASVSDMYLDSKKSTTLDLHLDSKKSTTTDLDLDPKKSTTSDLHLDISRLNSTMQQGAKESDSANGLPLTSRGQSANQGVATIPAALGNSASLCSKK